MKPRGLLGTLRVTGGFAVHLLHPPTPLNWCFTPEWLRPITGLGGQPGEAGWDRVHKTQKDQELFKKTVSSSLHPQCGGWYLGGT